MFGKLRSINVHLLATEPLGMGLEDFAFALMRWVQTDFGIAWGVDCILNLDWQNGAWDYFLVDDPSQPGILALHDISPNGIPRAILSLRECKRWGVPLTVAASHELGELLVNPYGTFGVWSPRGRFLALEPCDPVERSQYVGAGDYAFSSYVFPSWFGYEGDGNYDRLAECTQPFQVQEHGYIPYYSHGVWGNIFGSVWAENHYAQKDRRCHRIERNKQTDTDIAASLLNHNPGRSYGLA